MFKGQQGVLIVTCAFLSTLIHVTGYSTGQEYCGWVTTDPNRKVESKEKTALTQKRTKQYCVSTESTDSTQIICKTRNHHPYLRRECYCTMRKLRVHECNLKSFNCSKCLDYQDVVCMNKGRIGNTSLELCKEEHLLECECPEGFSGKLCEDVLERRKCRISLPSEDLKGLEECGQGDSNEANCRLQYKDNRPYKCFEAANDLESVQKIGSLKNCSRDFLHSVSEKGHLANDDVKDTESGDDLIIGLVCGVVVVLVIGFGFVFYWKRRNPPVRFENLSSARVDQNLRPQNICMENSEMNRRYDVVTGRVDRVNHDALADSGAEAGRGAESRNADCYGQPPEYESPVKCEKELPRPQHPCLNSRSVWRGENPSVPEYETQVLSSAMMEKNRQGSNVNIAKGVQNVVRASEYVDMSGAEAMNVTNVIAETNSVVDPNEPNNLQHESVYAKDNLENKRLESVGQREETLSSGEEYTDEQSVLLNQDPLCKVVQ